MSSSKMLAKKAESALLFVLMTKKGVQPLAWPGPSRLVGDLWNRNKHGSTRAVRTQSCIVARSLSPDESYIQKSVQVSWGDMKRFHRLFLVGTLVKGEKHSLDRSYRCLPEIICYGYVQSCADSDMCF